MFSSSRYTFITNTYKSNTLSISYIIIWCIVTRIDLKLQDVKTLIIFMRNHFYLWQRIHIITYLGTDDFTNMLYISNSFHTSIIINTKENRAAKSIGKSAYTL